MTIHETPEPEVHLRDYVRVIKKHRWLVTAVFLVTVVTVAIWTFTQVPIFQASATVLIEPEAAKVLNIQEVAAVGAPGQDYYQTQYEILKSRPVVEKVIEQLKLRQRIPAIGEAADPVRAMLDRIKIEPKRNTRLVFVKFEDPDPAIAAQVANALAATYTKYNLDIKLKAAQDALQWLTEQMGDLRSKVQASATTLQNYRVKAGIMGLQQQRQIQAQKIMDFNKAYLEGQAQRLTIEAKLNELKQIASDKSGAETIFTVADSQLIRKLKADIADLEVQRSRLLKTYKEKHPEVLKVDAQIQQVAQKIDGEIELMIRAVETEYKVARAREETLLGNVNSLRREAQDLNEKEIQYLALQRENESNQQLYEAVLKRLKETGVTGGLETNNVRVIESAIAPTVPIKPRKRLNLALSVAIGFVLGLGLAFTIEYFDTTVKSPDELERYLGVPVIGIVPMFSTGKR
jgi:polysaccharide biosynthesis transport protein